MSYSIWRNVAKFPILMYHIVAEPISRTETKLACTPKSFRKQMRYLKRRGCNVVSLEEAVSFLRHESALPEKSVVITFDDGYIDTYENAYPILMEFGFPATIFAVSDLVGKSNKWVQNEGGYPRTLCSWRQLKEMAENGMSIGSHTATHASLDQISLLSVDREVIDSKRQIEANLSLPIQFFAYPYGRYNEETQKQVQEAGYIAACSTNSGFNTQYEDLFLLRRIDIFGTDRLWQFKFKIEFGVNSMPFSLILKYYRSRILPRVKINE